MRRNGSKIGPLNTTSNTSASGLFPLEDVNPLVSSNIWPVGVQIQWNTNSGSLGTVTENNTFTAGVNASANVGSITYSIASGSLPGGMSLNSSTGTITGTPSLISGNILYDFTIRAASSLAASIYLDRAFSITVNDSSISWSTGTSLPSGILGSSYTTSVSATSTSNITPSYTIVSGSLPSGVSLASNGSISGTPSSSGSFSVTIRATSAGVSADRTFGFTITAAYRYWEIKINSVNGGGSQTQLTELHFRNSSNAFVSQSIYYYSGNIQASNGNALGNMVNNNGGGDGDHSNFDPLPYTLRYDLGSSYLVGNGGIKYVRIGGSDDSNRYTTNVTIRASITSDFSSGATTIYSGGTSGFQFNGASDFAIA